MNIGASGKTRVTVLGAGPAGVAAAYRLSQRDGVAVQVLERGSQVGGNASSFQIEGVWCDFGSHRFHPAAGPDIIRDVKQLLGHDLLLRPRHGRIRLGGRWIHFPLKPADALLRLPKSFAASLLADMALKPLRGKPKGAPTFASTLRAGLGPTIAEQFYFPYVTKLWGLKPDELAVELAERRVSGSSVGKIVGKMMGQLPGLRSPTAGRFYYPRQGFGQIAQRTAEAAVQNGAAIRFGADIKRIERQGSRAVAVWTEREGQPERIEAEHIWSTIPISALVKAIEPPAPPEVLAAASAIRSRGMILIYLVLEQDRFSEYDAHYFPELSIPISRMSETKNYYDAAHPKDLTVLCAELPCNPGEEYWSLSDDELGTRFAEWLASVGLPVTAKVRRTLTRRLGHAYPVYDLGYEEKFRAMDEWLAGIEGLLTFGRQGLFAHDNTHHAFAMAYGAADSLRADGTFDAGAWAQRRKEFESHVVED